MELPDPNSPQSCTIDRLLKAHHELLDSLEGQIFASDERMSVFEGPTDAYQKIAFQMGAGSAYIDSQIDKDLHTFDFQRYIYDDDFLESLCRDFLVTAFFQPSVSREIQEKIVTDYTKTMISVYRGSRLIVEPESIAADVMSALHQYLDGYFTVFERLGS
jgi:hypothetical protein